MRQLDSALEAGLGLVDLTKRALRAALVRAGGLALLAAVAAFCLALATWNVSDPSLSNATAASPRNLLGLPGSIVSDLLIQIAGLAVIVLPLPPAMWGIALWRRAPLPGVAQKILALVGCMAAATAFFSCVPAPSSWPLPTGLGGILGDGLRALPLMVVPAGVSGLANVVLALAALAASGFLFLRTADWRRQAAGALPQEIDEDDFDEPEIAEDDDAPSEGLLSRIVPAFGAATHSLMSLKARFRRLAGNRSGDADAFASHDEHGRHEPRIGIARAYVPQDEDYEPYDDDDAIADEPVALREQPGHGHPGHDQQSRVQPGRDRLKQGKRLNSEAQPSLLRGAEYEFPPLRLLAEAPKRSGQTVNTEALDQNARLLESVLEDFGVRGEIINVRPGPVVTLYELEPAPGTKSSRVIGLADDIARSMSAVSARVAVVPGRNAIGIELPNSNRDTVYLRELLASEDFEKNKSRLPLCLGKTIGGEPVIADLARMPHLLIAGTTGSGKSVAINTMILSILYRLSPDACKLIMVDPKMLELSVYDGIPHLLSPVVTDPRKAVVALKWTVREMEDRYRKMSKVGVRNIDGYNQKVASGKGETFTREVQTGFDPETGQPIYEREEIALEPMPYIVVIIDEMADLMMVAGKDIEGAVQRLAQMARAAGIHVVMATQRPSVDVITGTIKANFPTRISFQVTSKIDSRTILGEQGAEQLLGQGDMLYMMGGGRITRVHGPFCSDDEVEEVVAHLKAQGAPAYLDEITEEPEDGAFDMAAIPGAGGAGEGNELYDQAVAVVIRDRKASTSYVQRRLSIGYNRAATLIERMEQEGVISRPNSKGHREILVGEDASE
ncbi:MAG: DNA translocase FtsK 4TM domain-containing protein [Flavobacteriaceae bacterium]